MITDEQFTAYITKMGEQYEDLKDFIVKSVNSTDEIFILFGKLAQFRDTACIALREAHTNKNFNDN